MIDGVYGEQPDGSMLFHVLLATRDGNIACMARSAWRRVAHPEKTIHHQVMKRTSIVIGLLIAAWVPDAAAQSPDCPADRPTVLLAMDNTVAEPQRDIAQRIIDSVGPANPNRIVLLSADVIADFSDVGDGEKPLVSFGRCVTLGSYTASKAGGAIGPGRTARQPGPQLLFGSNANRSAGVAFIDITCADDKDGEGARISGIRLRGPSLDDQ